MHHFNGNFSGLGIVIIIALVIWALCSGSSKPSDPK